MSTKFKSLLRIVLVGAVAITGLSLSSTSGWAQTQQGGCYLWNSENAIRALAQELFTGWNDALKTGQPDPVVARYAPSSVLLPTVSDQPRVTADEKRDYFEHFQLKKPSGEVSSIGRKVFCDNNTLIDAGLYTFTYDPAHLTPGQPLFTRARYSFTYQFEDGKWRIKSHHSSAMPETEALCYEPPNGNPAQQCPSNCGFRNAYTSWSWGVWSGKTNAEGACQCFKTPKMAGNPAPPCQAIPVKQ